MNLHTVKPVQYLLLLVLILTALVYLPGLNGPFVFDDIPQIKENPALQINQLSVDNLLRASRSYGDWPFQRPLSMLSLALNGYASGENPFGFKLTNLIIHFLNGILIFGLTHLLLNTPRARLLSRNEQEHQPPSWIPLFVSAAWLLHPLNVTTVLLVVQRMASLSALFCLAGMALYTHGRLLGYQRRRGGIPAILASFVLATPLAYLSKENGILLPAYLFLIEWLLFGFGAESRESRRWLTALFGIGLGLPALYIGYLIWTHPTLVTIGYHTRPFTLEQRILTEPRVLWFYLKLLIIPHPLELSLFHDDIPLSNGLMTPWTTLLAIPGLFGLITFALLWRKRWPFISFGLLFFFVGHSIESTVFPLEIVHEHRNYLPGFGILLAIASNLGSWHASRPGRYSISIAIAILLVFFTTTTALRANCWSDAYRLALTGVTEHPDSARWNQLFGHLLWQISRVVKTQEQQQTLYTEAREHFLRAAALNSFTAPGSLLSVLRMDSSSRRASDSVVMTELHPLLAQGPVAPITITNFIRLLECRAGTECDTPISGLQELVSVLIENPFLWPGNRGQILAAAAQFAINRVGLLKALQYATAAVEAAPEELQHRLNLAHLEILAKQPDLAAEAIEYVRKHDDTGAYTAEIHRLSISLATATDRRK